MNFFVVSLPKEIKGVILKNEIYLNEMYVEEIKGKYEVVAEWLQDTSKKEEKASTY